MYLAAKHTHEYCHGKAKNRFSFHCFWAKKYLVITAFNNINLLRSSYKIPDFYLISDKFGVFRHIFVEVPNIKFYENPSVGNHGDNWGERETGWKTGGLRVMTNLKDFFPTILENAPKKWKRISNKDNKDIQIPSKHNKIYYTLPLLDYMFRLLRVIIRPSSELI